MIEDKRLAVVIPAYNEEKLLETTLAGIPAFVDQVYVVDDASRDGTVGRAHTAASRDSRIRCSSTSRIAEPVPLS